MFKNILKGNLQIFVARKSSFNQVFNGQLSRVVYLQQLRNNQLQQISNQQLVNYGENCLHYLVLDKYQNKFCVYLQKEICNYDVNLLCPNYVTFRKNNYYILSSLHNPYIFFPANVYICTLGNQC
eukprot:TRINITY_DN6618_c0_g1_i2.p5 TRINITY_DN6618_c0_g1~~TRINITY_DN6618_c0_g1_i2.p5  ORF type:complete len:125 (+),score=2.29 TRINITY_DN6618_c0_g1_i2:193-567(+)